MGRDVAPPKLFVHSADAGSVIHAVRDVQAGQFPDDPDYKTSSYHSN